MFGFLLVTFMATCVVGDLTGIQPLIIGGKRISIEDAPFMAQYLSIMPTDRVYMCGGSILSDRFVLSAAHCYSPDSKHFVMVGSDVSMSKNGAQALLIEKVQIHPLYNNISLDYDVLVLKLQGKMTFSAKVKPIKMAEPGLVLKEGAILETFGFGLTEDGSTSKYLLKVRIPYIDQKRCKFLLKGRVTDRMMCAGKRNRDSCRGDSGGPLVYGNILVGVVSFGDDCGSSPGGYARVSSVRAFIDDVMDST